MRTVACALFIQLFLFWGDANAQHDQRWNFVGADEIPPSVILPDSSSLEIYSSSEFEDTAGLKYSCSSACQVMFRSDSLDTKEIGHIKIEVRLKSAAHQTSPIIFNAGMRMIDGASSWNPKSVAPDADWQIVEVLLPSVGQASQAWVSIQLQSNSEIFIDFLKMTSVTTGLDSDDEFDQGSGLSVQDLSSRPVQDYALAAKVWGFAKYYHPKAYSGELHWDFEFIRLLELLARNPVSPAREIILGWLEANAPVEPCVRCSESSEEPLQAIDLSWINNDMLLGEELGRLLREVYANRDSSAPNYWVSKNPWAGQAMFGTELAYRHFDFPDPGFRILAIARAWNIIEYWYPYKHLIDRNWSDVLGEYLPAFLSADSVYSYELAFQNFMTELDDTHAQPAFGAGAREGQFSAFYGSRRLPLKFTWLEDQMVVAQVMDSTLSKEQADHLVGSRVISIDGESILELSERTRQIMTSSNERTHRRHMANLAALRFSDRSEITFVADGDTISNSFVTGASGGGWFNHEHPGPGFQLMGENVGLIKVSNFNPDSLSSVLPQLQQLDYLVVDARGYPANGGLWALMPHFFDVETTFATFTNSDWKHPGNFVLDDDDSFSPLEPRIDLPMAVLVNEYTQSSGEYHVMMLQATQKAIVIGSQTAGADGNVTGFSIPGGYGGMFTGIGVYYPDGRPTQQVGVSVDIWSQPTISGFMDGRDEVLEDALRVLLGEEVSEEAVRSMASRK